jgi:cell division inhibitor SepF
MANWFKSIFEGKKEEEEEIVFKNIDDKTAPVAAPAAIAEAEREEPRSNSSIEGNNIELKVVRPESIDEVMTIADYLIAGCTVVLNLEALDEGIIERMLDFLNGVSYVRGGDIKNVSPGTFIITPNGININK